MNQLLVLVRLQLELLGGDLAVLVAVLVLEHVAYGFLPVLPRQEAPFALTDLSLDEGGELGKRRAGEGGCEEQGQGCTFVGTEGRGKEPKDRDPAEGRAQTGGWTRTLFLLDATMQGSLCWRKSVGTVILRTELLTHLLRWHLAVFIEV